MPKFLIVALLLAPMVASADLFDSMDTVIDIFNRISQLLFSVAVVVFFWGIVKFIWNAGDERAVAEGRQIITWSLIGMFVIVSVWGLVALLQSALKLEGGSGGTTPSIPTVVK